MARAVLTTGIIPYGLLHSPSALLVHSFFYNLQARFTRPHVTHPCSPAPMGNLHRSAHHAIGQLTSKSNRPKFNIQVESRVEWHCTMALSWRNPMAPCAEITISITDAHGRGRCVLHGMAGRIYNYMHPGTAPRFIPAGLSVNAACLDKLVELWQKRVSRGGLLHTHRCEIRTIW